MEYAASVYNHYASKAGIAQALAERARYEDALERHGFIRRDS